MINLIFGLVVGSVVAIVYMKSISEGKKISWVAWLIYFSGICSLFFAVDTLCNSYAEYESQAAWMGLGLFGFVGIILIVMGHRMNLWIASKGRKN